MTNPPTLNCWTPATESHTTWTCPHPTRTPFEREKLRLKLGIDSTGVRYDITLGFPICINCWKSVRHDDKICPEVRRSTMEREMIRQQEGMPMTKKWSRVLVDVNAGGLGVDGTMEDKEVGGGKGGGDVADAAGETGAAVEDGAPKVEELEKPLPPHLRWKKKLAVSQEVKKAEEIKNTQEIIPKDTVNTEDLKNGQDSDLKEDTQAPAVHEPPKKKAPEADSKNEQTSRQEQESSKQPGIGVATALFDKQRMSALAKKQQKSGSHSLTPNNSSEFIDLIDFSNEVVLPVAKPANGPVGNKHAVAAESTNGLRDVVTLEGINNQKTSNGVYDLLGDIEMGSDPAIASAVPLVEHIGAEASPSAYQVAVTRVSPDRLSDPTEVDSACPACIDRNDNDEDINTSIHNLVSTIKSLTTSETNITLTNISRLENKQIIETNTAMSFLGSMQMRLNTIEEFQARCSTGGDIHTMLWNVKRRMDVVQRQMAIKMRQEYYHDEEEEEQDTMDGRRDKGRIQREEREGWESEDTKGGWNGARGFGHGGTGRNGGSFRGHHRNGMRGGFRSGSNGMNGQAVRGGFRGVPSGPSNMNSLRGRSFRAYR